MVTQNQRNQALRWLRATHFRFSESGDATTNMSANQIKFMNRVLCRIETYSSNIESMSAAQTAPALTQLIELLQQGNSFNRGMANMDEALLQLSEWNGHRYEDRGTSTYNGGSEKCYPRNVESWDPFVWFAQALDDRLSDARARLLDYNSTFEELAQRVATSNTDNDTWNSVKTAFDSVAAARAHVERSHWLLGIPVQQISGYARSQEFAREIDALVQNPTLRHSLGAYDLISTLDTAARLSVQIQAAAGENLNSSSENAVRQFSQLLGILRVTCKFLPVLSSFYESMFDGIPGLVSSFRSSLAATPRRLETALRHDAMTNVQGLTPRGSRSSSLAPAIHQSLCTACGCRVLTPCS